MRRIPLAGTLASSAALLAAVTCTARSGEPEQLVPSGLPLQVDDTSSTAPPPAEVHLNLIDQKLALSLAIDNHGQIEMAEYALKNITNEALRRFINERLKAQRDLAARLNVLTDGRTESALAEAQRDIERDRAAAERDKRFRMLSVRYATAMLVRIRVEIQQEFAAMQQRLLAEKSADRFDRYYLEHDMLNQMQALAAMKIYENQASADFAEVIHEAWASAQAHLAASQQLLLELDAAPLADVAPAKTEVAETAGRP